MELFKWCTSNKRATRPTSAQVMQALQKIIEEGPDEGPAEGPVEGMEVDRGATAATAAAEFAAFRVGCTMSDQLIRSEAKMGWIPFGSYRFPRPSLGIRSANLVECPC